MVRAARRSRHPKRSHEATQLADVAERAARIEKLLMFDGEDVVIEDALVSAAVREVGELRELVRAYGQEG
jgi:hypothetical protein